MTGILPPLILLTAGESLRMGEPKGLVRVGERPWIEIQMRRFAAAGGSHAVVVLGYHREEYMKALPWLSGEGDREMAEGIPKSSIVVNPETKWGPFSSLMAGWNFLRSEKPDSPAFVLPVDVPCPTKEVLRSLQIALLPGIEASVPVYEERGGHPILASASLLEKLRFLSFKDPEARLDRQIKKLSPESLRKVPVREKIVLLNMNRKEDFLAALKIIEEQ